MSQGTWRLWNISISILVFLTAYNIFLTIKLMYTTNCENNGEPRSREKPPHTPQTIFQKCDTAKREKIPRYFSNLDLSLGRWDNRLQYKLFDNIITGDKYTTLNDLYQTCLATQSSLDKIASIIEVGLHWNGPISLAAFAASEKELNLLLVYILYLRRCDPRIREKVTFHLALAKDKRPTEFEIDYELLDSMDCGDPIGILKGFVRDIAKGSSFWRTRLPYPQNHLRNLARKNCQTKNVFLTDVDIIPSKGMAEGLDKFLKNVKCRGLCAYVVPTYELDERVLFPSNKTALIRLASKGLARPFHHKVFIYNQYATNFSRWQTVKDDGEDIHVSHPVTNFEFLYEPFYIAPDIAPPHDERFVGYGYTRNSQVYEMFVAGYEFYVLSPIFTCHWGLQVKRTRPSWREHQNNVNRKHFDSFKKEIFARYSKDPLNMMASKKN